MNNNKDIEIEIKIRLNENEFRYQKKQFDEIAIFIKEENQRDMYFTPKYKDFTKEKYPYEWLSVRERDENKILNYKHYYPEKEEKHVYCDELEINIDDTEKIKKILNNLDINCFAEIRKKRYIYMYNDKYEIALDHVEKLGYFIEIEIKKIEGDYIEERNKLYEIATKLGLNLKNIDLRGYPFYYIKQKE